MFRTRYLRLASLSTHVWQTLSTEYPMNLHPHLLVTALLCASPVFATANCPGDCNADDSVTVNEIITLVNMAFGLPATCGDAFDGAPVDVSVLISAVNAALTGCPLPCCPTVTPTFQREDVNCDRQVDIVDAMLVAQVAHGLRPPLTRCTP